MALGFGREGGREARDSAERARETRDDEPLDMHAAIHWAILGGRDLIQTSIHHEYDCP